jgi:hypothetical protein
MITKSNIALFVALLLISISGACYKYVTSTKTDHLECQIAVDSCTLLNESGAIRIKFLTAIETEEEMLLNIDLPKGLSLDEAWIEGVNMFMGKTPVMLENNQYITFLGSCSLSKMEWKLNLKISDKNGLVQLYSAIFYTTQS